MTTLDQAVENLRKTLESHSSNPVERAAQTRLLKVQAQAVVNAWDRAAYNEDAIRSGGSFFAKSHFERVT